MTTEQRRRVVSILIGGVATGFMVATTLTTLYLFLVLRFNLFPDNRMKYQLLALISIAGFFCTMWFLIKSVSTVFIRAFNSMDEQY